MPLLLASVALLTGGGLLALCTCRWPRLANRVGVVSAVVASLVGLVPTVHVMAGGTVEPLSVPWQADMGGAFSVDLDPLSALFLLSILILSALAAVYAGQYLRSYEGRKNLGAVWFFFNLLAAGMVLVVLARNGLLFLVAWELTALTSFFLITLENEKETVRQAGWIYLVATHLGAAFLLALFIVLGSGANGSLEFERIAAAGPPAAAGVLFLLAVVGFGAKAGFMPFHVWLPEAHPAAPSFVSAILSGVMIKLGIYGLMRVLTFLGQPEPWWAWVLIGIGLVSSIFGILLALAQKDLKRLLAYSSIENMGIIALGLGTGLWGLSSEMPALAVLGFAGALLHVINHGLFKGLLFLGAGAVLHGAKTTELDRLGGLWKRMPWTGTAFLVGAAAICGLPPLNGFASEFLIFLGALQEETVAQSLVAAWPLAVIAGLGLVGGLAAACFTKVFGIVFLGSPRSEAAALAKPTPALMRIPMTVLAVGCLVLGLCAPLLLPLLGRAVAVATAGVLPAGAAAASLQETARPLWWVTGAACFFLTLIGGLAYLRWRLLRDRTVTTAETWGCGYAQPTPRMQYTASSFSQPLTEWFGPLLGTRKQEPALEAHFPGESTLSTETPEPWTERVYQPAFSAFEAGLHKLRWLQHGRVQLYVLYITLTILFLLVWYLGWET